MYSVLKKSTLPYGAIDFENFDLKELLPAFKEALDRAYKKLDEYKIGTEVSFASVVLPIEELEEEISHLSHIFYCYHGAHSLPVIVDAAQEFSELGTKFGNTMNMDEKIFGRVKALFDDIDNQDLTAEQRKIVERYYVGFTRNGALLNNEDKEKLKKIDERLGSLSISFSENVRNATNAYTLFIESEADLDGFPDNLKEAAAETAKAKGKDGQWAFTLDFPSYFPFMQNCKNRELRRQINFANTTRCTTGEFNNQENVLEIVKLRYERATLLGYKTHAHYVLDDRMAATPERVEEFLKDFRTKASALADSDMNKLKEIQQEMEGKVDFQNWDTSFYTKILKQRELELDDEMTRPYFELEKTVNGAFQVANKLYGINFEKTDIKGYHEDVTVYKATEENGDYLGLFYTDFFPRETKRPGAWMTNYKDQGWTAGVVERPHVAIVCNFTKPTASTPSLLTINEVLTLFHEFGHALHGLMTKCQYRSLNGTNVFWDFVELPSQIMENWVTEKECLDLFAVHYETGEKIPESLVQKIKDSQVFLEGLATMRQVSFGALDMNWHNTESPEKFKSVLETDKESLAEFSQTPHVEGTSMSCAFGHIFAGGYSAGYYSYKWAEVLDADAFEYFKEKGIFNKEVATKFKENILERGGTAHPMELYKNFRGQEPTVDALLKRAGLA